MIALPLQKARRRHGLTEFVDEKLQPYEDQWKVLAEVPRLSLDELEDILSGELGVTANDTDSLELESLILEVTSTDPIDYSVVPDWKIHLAENFGYPN